MTRSLPDWKDLGHHFHCYKWEGSGNDLCQDGERLRPDTLLPPFEVRQWLHKPASLMKYAPKTPYDAVTWLRHEFEAIRDNIGDQATFIKPEFRFRSAMNDLTCGGPVSWGFWLGKRAPTFLALAIVGTPEGCHYREDV